MYILNNVNNEILKRLDKRSHETWQWDVSKFLRFRTELKTPSYDLLWEIYYVVKKEIKPIYIYFRIIPSIKEDIRFKIHVIWKGTKYKVDKWDFSLFDFRHRQRSWVIHHESWSQTIRTETKVRHRSRIIDRFLRNLWLNLTFLTERKSTI